MSLDKPLAGKVGIVTGVAEHKQAGKTMQLYLHDNAIPREPIATPNTEVVPGELTEEPQVANQNKLVLIIAVVAAVIAAIAVTVVIIVKKKNKKTNTQ